MYSSYKTVFDKEKSHLYYDDVTYIYRSYFIANQILSNESIVFDDVISEDNMLTSLNTENQAFSYFKDAYHLNQVLIIKPVFNLIKECPIDYTNSCKSDDCLTCMKSFKGLDHELIEYIKTINYAGNNYVLVFDYIESRDGLSCSDNVKCVHYYVFLDSGVNYE